MHWQNVKEGLATTGLVLLIIALLIASCAAIYGVGLSVHRAITSETTCPKP